MVSLNAVKSLIFVSAPVSRREMYNPVDHLKKLGNKARYSFGCLGCCLLRMLPRRLSFVRRLVPSLSPCTRCRTSAPFSIRPPRCRPSRPPLHLSWRQPGSTAPRHRAPPPSRPAVRRPHHEKMQKQQQQQRQQQPKATDRQPTRSVDGSIGQR